MAIHSIAELLSAGQAPTADERTDLKQIASFAASLFSRHLHGTERPPVNRVDFSESWATNVSHNLSASTATRWSDGMGPLLGDLLADEWGGFFGVQAGSRQGYGKMDMSSVFRVIELMEEEGLEPPPELEDDGDWTPRRSGSLFGPRVDRVQVARRLAKKRPAVMKMADGTRMAREVVEAFESAGLYMDDQVQPELPSPAEMAALPGMVFSRGGQPQRIASEEPSLPTRVALDGLVVDQRTPALASALGWAEAAFGDGEGRMGPTVTRRRIMETVQDVAARHVIGAEPESRPVFSFFDSVEGDFLRLQPEVIKTQPPVVEADEPMAAEAVSLFAPQTQQTLSPTPASPTSPATAARRTVQPLAAATAQPMVVPRTISTSLNRVAPPSAKQVGQMVRPVGDAGFTSGLAPQRPLVSAPQAPTSPLTVTRTPTAQPAPIGRVARRPVVPMVTTAQQVTYRRDGRPQPRVQRGAAMAPRVQVASQPAGEQAVQAAAPSVAQRWVSAADGGQDLPLGASLTAPEMLAGTVSRRRAATPSAVTEFRPLVARAAMDEAPAPEFRMADAALPGVSWVAMENSQPYIDDIGVPLATQPTQRRAAMVPADTALELAASPMLQVDTTAPLVDISTDPSVATVLEPDLFVAPAALASAAANGVVPQPAIARLAESFVRPNRLQAQTASMTSVGLSETAAPVTGVDADFADVPAIADAAPMLAARPEMRLQVASDLAASFGTRPMSRLGRDERVMVAQVADAPGIEASAQVSDVSEAAVAAPQTGASSLFTTVVQPMAAPRAAAAGAAPAPEATAVMREARRAMQRPVTTARETMAVQRMLTPARAAVAADASRVSTPVAEAIAAVQQAAGVTHRQALPALVQVLEQRQNSGAIAPAVSAASTEMTQAVAELSRLAPARRQEVARQLRLAGFSQPELAMLQVAEVQAPAQSMEATVAAEAMTPTADVELGTAVQATVTRAARNLARVLTGTEALASRWSDKASPEAPVADGGQAVAAALSGINTILETVSSDYFGSLAPERVRAASPTLRSAIGDLLSLAEEAAVAVPAAERFIAAGGMESDAPVPAALQPQLLDQIGRIQAVVAKVESSATLGAAPSVAGTAPGMVSSEASFEPLLQVDAVAASEGPAAGYRRLAGQGAIARQFLQLARLEGRIAGALDASTSGPAGAERLMGGLNVPSALGTATPTRMAQLPGAAKRADRATVGEPLELSQVIAPEAMLGGMTGPDLQERFDTQVAGAQRYPGSVGELTGFADVAEAAEVAAESGPASFQPAATTRPNLVAMRPVRRLGRVLARRGEAVAQPGRRAAQGRVGQAGELVSQIQERVAAGSVDAAPASRSQVAASGPLADLIALADTSGGRAVNRGAMARLMGRLERRDTLKLGSDAAVRDFAVSWMKRVDGSMSGVDVGLEGERTELRKFFGVTPKVQVDSAVAKASPMRGGGADLVNPAPAKPVQQDRAGLHRVAEAAAGAPRGGAQQKAATQALGSLNWNYVKTGSAASTQGDLSGLAATAASSSAAGSRVAFPLVAPAVKAVAQTAMRSARSESMEPGGGRVEGVRGDAGPGADASAAPKLSKAALQKLARDMAGRVAKILDRNEKDRRGSWA